MLTIALPKHLSSTRLLAGIEFTNGSATVAKLGSHARRFLELTGATITDAVAEPIESTDTSMADAIPVAENTEAIAALHAGGKLLTDCSVPELRKIAKTEGIALPARATKPEILHAFLIALHEEE